MDIQKITKEAVLIRTDATFHDAVKLMMQKDTNSLLVVDEKGVLVGEINVSDLLDAIVPLDVNGDTVNEKLGTEESFGNAVLAASDVVVSDFMNPSIQSVHTNDSLITIAGTAIAHQTAHLPVVDHDDHPVGVISRRGLKYILAKYLDIRDSSQ